MRALYVTWDGAEQTYLESLFLPILARVQQWRDIAIHVLQYSWQASEQAEAVRAAAERCGVGYTWRPIERRSALATVPTVASATRDIVRNVHRLQADVIMPRSLIPATMCLPVFRLQPRTRLIFDADGLMADERADFGGWRRVGARYRFLRAVESFTVRRADATIVRTEAARQLLADRCGDPSVSDRITVVRNGRDPSTFKPLSETRRAEVRRQLGVPQDAPVVAYVGSIGPQYCLPEMLRFFQLVRDLEPRSHFVAITSRCDEVRSQAAVLGVPIESLTVRSASVHEVPELIGCADVGLSLRRAAPSQLAVSPIKVGEYLLAGVPVVASAGVGDMSSTVFSRIGHLVHEDREDDLRSAATWLIREVLPRRAAYQATCRDVGVRLFSIDSAARGYLAGGVRPLV